jgi:hypothetical protein
MTHRNVETLLGKLATDAEFRRRFFEDPSGLLAEFRDRGPELTAIELQALASTKADAVREFAASVDRRIQKAEFPGSDRSQD